MTQLGDIPRHHIALMCEACGHHGYPLLAVSSLIEKIGPDVTVHEVASRARCSNCHVKGDNSFRIVYVGGSDEAMQGTRTGS